MEKHPGLGPADDFRIFWRDRWYRHETEVRWMYLFETLGLEPEYEPTGVKLNCLSCGGYRPDFYLAALDTWVEIKAGRPDEDAFAKAKALTRATGKAVLLIWGAPSARAACWVFRPTDLRHAGPMILTSWLPLDGLALTSEKGSLVIQLNGIVASYRYGEPRQSDHMQIAVAAALQLPLMPNDRLREAS